MNCEMTTAAPSGNLGIFTVGMGAVATTLMAGVELARRGRLPVGSFTQLGLLASGRPAREALPLASLENLRFGGVDLVETDAAGAARTAGVLTPADLAATAEFLGGISAGPGVYDAKFVRRLSDVRAHPETNKAEQAAAMQRQYREFLTREECSRGVVLLCLSTEAWQEPGAAHATPASFRAALARNDPAISPSQIYAWAALEAGLPVVNCTPNPVLESPAITARALELGLPITGSDLKSGQTYMKTVIAAALGQRLLGVKGWYSTNILGNRDGQVLDDPANFRAKEIAKTGVVTDLLNAQVHPELYGDLEHQVHIHYFPPKGDNKESWDAIQLFGWLGYEMELKINFQCRDSVLAAPLVLDLALLLDLAARNGCGGIQSWLSGYFKKPAFPAGVAPTNDPRTQFEALQRQLAAWEQ